MVPGLCDSDYGGKFYVPSILYYFVILETEVSHS